MKRYLLPALAMLALPIKSFASLCDVDRYEFIQENLNPNDTLTLTVGSTQMSAVLDANTAIAPNWQKVMAELVNANVPAVTASAGATSNLSLLNRYLPDNSGNNVIDVKPEGVNVSLDINGLGGGPLIHSYDSRTGVSGGSAVISGWTKSFASSNVYNFINISNITDQQVTVYVKLYTQDGSLYTESTESGTQVIINNNNITNVSTILDPQGVTLNGHQTISFSMNKGAQKFGYARIEWSSDSCLDYALTGTTMRHAVSGHAATGGQFAINGGKPF